jgi:hypothetical protein
LDLLAFLVRLDDCLTPSSTHADEEPLSPEIVVDARDAAGNMQSAEDMAADILRYLEQHGYLGASSAAPSDAQAATA